MVRLLFASLALIPVGAGLSSPAMAQEDAAPMTLLESRAADVVAAMRGEAVYGDVFADSFTAQVAEGQFLAIKEQMEAQFGPMIGVDSVTASSETGGSMAIRFQRGIARATIQLQPADPHKVAGLLITGVEPIDDSAEKVLSDFRALPGEASLLVTRLGDADPVLAMQPDRQFAIGSAFKLYVLSALAQAVAEGEMAWDDVVPLSVASYPSGQMQDWPQGAPVTLHTLATLMISISDNTATDQLMAVLGRDRIEAEVAAAGHSDPQATLPFMTTREMFVLKSGDADAVAAYRAADTATRRTMLAGLADTDRSINAIMSAFSGGPNAIDLEWFASANDIARVMQRIAALDDDTALGVLGVSPSIQASARQQWDYVGYKGGSEPGVLNVSWLMRDDAGDWWVTVMSWNDEEAALDQQRLEMLSMRALALAAAAQD